MIDPKLRERILRTLRWLVIDTQHRFDECSQNLTNGSKGGYSPELKEAIQLLQDLEQGSLIPETTELIATRFCLMDCLDTGTIVGLTLEQSTEYFHQYNSQGWLKGNGLPIVNLQSSMFQWKKRGGQTEDTAKVSEWRE